MINRSGSDLILIFPASHNWINLFFSFLPTKTASVNPNGNSCPMALRLIACVLLLEITSFLRETYKSLPKTQRSFFPGAVTSGSHGIGGRVGPIVTLSGWQHYCHNNMMTAVKTLAKNDKLFCIRDFWPILSKTKLMLLWKIFFQNVQNTELCDRLKSKP